MKSTFRALLLAVSLMASNPSFSTVVTSQVQQKDIYEGYIVRKVWLSAYALPNVSISDIGYSGNVQLPRNAKTADPNKLQVSIGMERKRPFAIIRIPAYVASATPGIIQQVSKYTLTVDEPAQPKNKMGAKKTDVASSVLATGTWYKLGVTKTGFYKIDNTLLSSMGVKPSSVNPSNIRIVGNGGLMLSEDNAVPRASDLQENSLLVTDNGDNSFDNGESVVFYAVGTIGWQKDSLNQRFVHQPNLYSDTACYFISFDAGPGKRIATQATVPAANVTVNSYNFYAVHELDLVNPADLGKQWYGEQLNPALGNATQTFSFDLGSTIANLYCKVSMASTSGSRNCSFNASLNGNTVGSAVFSLPTTGDNVMNLNSLEHSVACNSQIANVTVTFNPADAGSVGYLNYIELNGRSGLTFSGDQFTFRDWQSVGAGKVANYQLQGANSNTRVWDVTNPQSPVLMSGSLSGSTYSFSQDASMLHEFAAMNTTNFSAPKYMGQVPNQNLHGSGQVDMIIVTYPGFQTQAKQLADFHASHDHLRVITATTTEVYNEFSSGIQDISAIRDFAKMFYDRATDSTQMPKYLLLFGGASYDYKNRVTNNSNYVPVFESAESSNDLNAFSTDDFYGFLDDNEYIENNDLVNALDIGVGRLPARSADDATALVNKVINYSSPATLGPWRLSTTIVADKGCKDPAGDHMSDAEAMVATVADAGNSTYNQQKVFVDAIPVISTPAGPRCPNANAALNEQVYNGTFLINYNGHGNPEVWSSERILTSDDYNHWNNANMLPIMVTATCDFGQFDRPQFVSSAEQLVVRKGGGVIAILTTTQAVYAYYNHELNVQYLDAQFTRNAQGKWNTFGEASRIGKNITYSKPAPHDPGEIANFRKFSLLGDPAVTPDFPEYKINIDSVTDGYTMAHADTIKALGAYAIKGSVVDNDGNLKTDFNGTVYISFFDKPRNITTISGCNDVFNLQDNVVYKGRVTVTNGKFSFTFIVPKDINYTFGAGKISCYAENGVTDAAGAEPNVIVGGFSDHPVLNTTPPVVHPYINDSLFLNGGITGSNTSLYVTFYDKTGINVSGTDIGHDLTAVLDDNVDAPYILNNYYQTLPNTYQHGFVSFPISGLADGRHSIRVKAWDVNDNTGEGTVDFTVIDGKVLDIQQLGNYPNPFTGTTHFVFEHNHPEELLDAQIEIYTTSGALVKHIHETYTPGGSRSADITWDGTDEGGNKLPSGVYVYRLNISTDKGYKSTAYQKLVIVR